MRTVAGRWTNWLMVAALACLLAQVRSSAQMLRDPTTSVQTGPAHTVEASPLHGVIQPGESAPALDARDKLLLGVVHSVSPLATTGWFFSAGYGQLNDTPHYGTDRGAFGERLGAAALRDGSESILAEGAAAAVFRQDPRYYRAGDGRSFGARLGSAFAQTFVARTDSGHRTVNVSLMVGTLAGSALTNAYYPQRDRTMKQTFETFGFSMEGSVIGNLVREFLPDAGRLVHRSGR